MRVSPGGREPSRNEAIELLRVGSCASANFIGDRFSISHGFARRASLFYSKNRKSLAPIKLDPIRENL